MLYVFKLTFCCVSELLGSSKYAVHPYSSCLEMSKILSCEYHTAPPAALQGASLISSLVRKKLLKSYELVWCFSLQAFNPDV